MVGSPLKKETAGLSVLTGQVAISSMNLQMGKLMFLAKSETCGYIAIDL